MAEEVRSPQNPGREISTTSIEANASNETTPHTKFQRPRSWGVPDIAMHAMRTMGFDPSHQGRLPNFTTEQFKRVLVEANLCDGSDVAFVDELITIMEDAGLVGTPNPGHHFFIVSEVEGSHLKRLSKEQTIDSLKDSTETESTVDSSAVLRQSIEETLDDIINNETRDVFETPTRQFGEDEVSQLGQVAGFHPETLIEMERQLTISKLDGVSPQKLSKWLKKRFGCPVLTAHDIGHSLCNAGILVPAGLGYNTYDPEDKIQRWKIDWTENLQNQMSVDINDLLSEIEKDGSPNSFKRWASRSRTNSGTTGSTLSHKQRMLSRSVSSISSDDAFNESSASVHHRDLGSLNVQVDGAEYSDESPSRKRRGARSADETRKRLFEELRSHNSHTDQIESDNDDGTANIAPVRNRRQAVLNNDGSHVSLSLFQRDRDYSGVTPEAISDAICKVAHQVNELAHSTDEVGLDKHNEIRESITSIEAMIGHYRDMIDREKYCEAEFDELINTAKEFNKKYSRFIAKAEDFQRYPPEKLTRGASWVQYWDPIELKMEEFDDSLQNVRQDRLRLSRNQRSLKSVVSGIDSNMSDVQEIILTIKNEIREELDWNNYIVKKTIVPYVLYAFSGILTQLLILVKVITDFVSATRHVHGNNFVTVVATVLLALVTLGLISYSIGSVYKRLVEHKWEGVVGPIIGVASVFAVLYVWTNFVTNKLAKRRQKMK